MPCHRCTVLTYQFVVVDAEPWTISTTPWPLSVSPSTASSSSPPPGACSLLPRSKPSRRRGRPSSSAWPPAVTGRATVSGACAIAASVDSRGQPSPRTFVRTESSQAVVTAPPPPSPDSSPTSPRGCHHLHGYHHGERERLPAVFPFWFKPPLASPSFPNAAAAIDDGVLASGHLGPYF